MPVRLHAPLIALLGSSELVLPLAVTGAAAGWLVGRSLGHTTSSVLTGAVLLAVRGSWLTRKSSP